MSGSGSLASLWTLLPMSLTAFIHGVVLSTALIIAIGPQNVFVFQQGVVQPRLSRALPTIVTAGVSDTILVLLAVFGASVVVLQFAWVRAALFGSGSLFLFYYGWKLLTSPAIDEDPQTTEFLGVREQIGFTASVSLLNPHAILDTIGIVGTNGLAYSGRSRWLFAAGCILVSWGAFSGLAVAGWRLGESSNSNRWVHYFNPISAIFMWVFALLMGWRLLGLLKGV